jgi:hypothetical protein
VNLKLRFPGLLLRNCEVYKDNQQIGSLKHEWSFFQQAIANYDTHEWKIREKGFIKTRVQLIDKANEQLVGEVTSKEKNSFLDAVGVKIKPIATIKIKEHLYALIKNQNNRSQYTWLNEDGNELIYYDFTNLENTVFYPFRFNRESVATIPDNPNKEQLALFFLGIFLLRLRLLRFAALNSGD